MPVFLLPIIVGGYYYWKNRKEELQGVQSEDTDTSGSTVETHARAAALEEECHSIEVSLVLETVRQQSGNCEPSWQDYHLPDDECDELAIRGVQSRVLSRKESMDTVQTEISEDLDAQRHPSIDNTTYTYSLGMLASSCVDCDHGFFLEIVDCGNSAVCESDTITALRRSNDVVEC